MKIIFSYSNLTSTHGQELVEAENEKERGKRKARGFQHRKGFLFKKGEHRESKGSVIIWPGISSKAVIVLPVPQHSEGQQNVYCISILLCLVALNKAFPIVIEMKLFGRYVINAIYGYQLYVYLVPHVKMRGDQPVL